MVGSTAKLRVAKAELEAEPKAAAEEEVRRRAEASACGRPQEEWLCAQAAE
jgi:hypothetical protein